MRKTTALTMLAGSLLLAIAGQAQAAAYEYHFISNPTVHETTIDPSLDVRFTFGFTDAALNSGALDDASLWQSGGVWLKATFQGQTVNLADAVESGEGGMLRLTSEPVSPHIPDLYSSGVIELWEDNFLDVDLHPHSSFVAAHNLPFDPFVYGQLNAYANQADHLAASAVWLHGDHSSLAAHAVPEPSTWAFAITGLAVVGTIARRKRAKAA